MNKLLLLAVVLGQLVVGSRALAAQPSPPPDPYATPPPGYGTPPPTYTAPQSSQTAFLLYDAQRKNAGLGIILEIFIPGLGSLYGDHAVGALITWALIVGGIAVVFLGASQLVDSADRAGPHDNSGATVEITVGIAMLLGGRIYGLIDSYVSTEDYNRRLRLKLGLPAGLSLGVGRVGSGPAMAVGPRLSFTF